MPTLAPPAATETHPDPQSDGDGSRFDPRDYQAESPEEALGFARDSWMLPEEVRLFYLRALRAAAHQEAPLSLGYAEHPRGLAHLLATASGCEQVVGFGGHTAISAISLALSDVRRRVTVFDPAADLGHRQEFVGLVDGVVRARLDFRRKPESTAPTMSSPDLVFMDRLDGHEESLAAARVGRRVLRPGGVLVVRDFLRREVDGVIAELWAEGSVVGGDFVWRKPVGDGRRPGDRAAPRRALRGFALTGVVAGLAAAVLLPSSLSESLPWTSGNDRDLLPAAPPARGGAGADGTVARPAARSSAQRSGGPRITVGGAVSGTGSRDLGTLRVDRPTLLRWSAEGRSFVILSEDWRFRAGERRGTTLLSPGTYRRFAVRSTARWRLKLDAVD